VRTGCLRPWVRFAALGALALAALLVSSAAQADDPATLRTQAERLRAQNDGLAARAQSALLDLYALETRLVRAERRVAALVGRREKLQRQEASARRQLEVARSDLEEAERRLGLRLQALYVQGEVDPLAVLLASESLDEALSAFDGLTRLVDVDGSIVEQVRRARQELRRSLETLGERRAALRELLAEAEAEEAALAAARAERAAYVASLESRRAFNARLIARLTTRAKTSAASTEASEPEASGPRPGGSRMTVDAVAYCGGVGTASGLPLGWGTVAVDPSVIPLGTKMYVPGYGDGVAADTGSAIIGRIIDLWFPSCAQARAWGRKTVTITLYW